MRPAKRTPGLLPAAVTVAFGAALHASPAAATVSPSTLDFGDVPFGGPSPPKVVSISAPKGAVFKSIFGYDQFQPVAGGCEPFKSTECTVTVFANNSLDRVAAFGQHGGYLLVTYTSGSPDYVTVNANFLPPPLELVSPPAGTNYPYSPSKLNSTDPIIFAAQGSTSLAITWTLDLLYLTSGGKCKACTWHYAFNSASKQEIPITFTSKGGQATTTAQQSVSGVLPEAAKFTVTGVAIPAATVTQQLLSLYQTGTSKRLMTGIAKKESNYLQFATRTLFGRSGLWPNESYDGGSHIGLMQMPVAMDTAWDWNVNTTAGVNLFRGKLNIVGSMDYTIRVNHTGLRTLTPTEREDMALVLYGPYASADLGKQYYVPSCVGGTVSGKECTGGAWQWVKNTAGNSAGVAYADSVKSKQQ